MGQTQTVLVPVVVPQQSCGTDPCCPQDAQCAVAAPTAGELFQSLRVVCQTHPVLQESEGDIMAESLVDAYLAKHSIDVVRAVDRADYEVVRNTILVDGQRGLFSALQDHCDQLVLCGRVSLQHPQLSVKLDESGEAQRPIGSTHLVTTPLSEGGTLAGTKLNFVHVNNTAKDLSDVVTARAVLDLVLSALVIRTCIIDGHVAGALHPSFQSMVRSREPDLFFVWLREPTGDYANKGYCNMIVVRLSGTLSYWLEHCFANGTRSLGGYIIGCQQGSTSAAYAATGPAHDGHFDDPSTTMITAVPHNTHSYNAILP